MNIFYFRFSIFFIENVLIFLDLKFFEMFTIYFEEQKRENRINCRIQYVESNKYSINFFVNQMI